MISALVVRWVLYGDKGPIGLWLGRLFSHIQLTYSLTLLGVRKYDIVFVFREFTVQLTAEMPNPVGREPVTLGKSLPLSLSFFMHKMGRLRLSCIGPSRSFLGRQNRTLTCEVLYKL